ncbi:hypothetical protein [Thalassococcus sp. S3]|uniref:hypothetical protein n=1 Tax=Thalassococcus sp. S3 TaxID=2017482 RepID=UPI0010246AA6|nr:hypothetical protein [Thalassococcus sp. S3]QBF31126.1 hypothetical protein CFI11_07820 [Thalassococcus sp. S3]
MPGYNTKFELNVEDIELIETALQARKSELCLKRLDIDEDGEEAEQIDATLADTHDLLGRLHNQKVFYRPKTVRGAPYIGG